MIFFGPWLRYASPANTCAKIARASRSGTGPCDLSRASRSSPVHSSSTVQKLSRSTSKTSIISTTLGCRRRLWIMHSRCAWRTYVCLRASLHCGESWCSLHATSRISTTSNALYTSENPPRPSMFMSTYLFPNSGCWLNRLASSSRTRFNTRMCACFSRSRSSRSFLMPSSSFFIAATRTLWISSESTYSACLAAVSGVASAPGGGSNFFTAFLCSSAASRAEASSRDRRAKSANARPSSQTSCNAAPARCTETVPSRAPTSAISRRACARSCCARRTASCFTPSTRARSRLNAASSRALASRASLAAASARSRASANARSTVSARRRASSASFFERLASSRAASSAAARSLLPAECACA
mmetsp:Transcript_4001/g.15950  ORF Transcript_4001/g.15950 Transcript_4001/m.15950 type:complete len:360 (+) Transcript_4001:640-1719(+)